MGTPLFNSSQDISLPLAAVYLKSFLAENRPAIRFTYHPRRLYEAEGQQRSLNELVQDGDVVLTSCSTADSSDAQRILEVAKAAGKVTAVGGIYPRFCHSSILDWGTADYVCTGEGERAFVEILDQVSGLTGTAPIAGVATPQMPRPTSAKLMDLSLLPAPDYSEFPIERFAKYMNSAYILATRGCPAPCHFCTSARLYGYSYRMRPVSHVIREIRDLHDRGFRKITMADDTVLVNETWASELFAELSRCNPGVRLKVRARADELSSELLRLMVDAGVEVVQFGVESIRLSTRTSMHKRLEQDAIERAFDLVLSNDGICANPLYMLAYPGEEWDDLDANCDFIARMGQDRRVITYISFTTPYPGTGFARSLGRSGGVLMTKDLKYYTNKFPVFIPGSMLDGGVEHALARLVATFDDVADCVNQSFPTQRRIPPEFFEELEVQTIGS
ncbi:B12-binding domain-containing radical SAM protein [Micromonospora zamorensis]|uniref:B12-binding domain-containing radical SAM protein n=1 Tax=Micromonospora zamorensis TaxID=709883 RepID=UPI0033C9FFC0